MVKVSLVGTLVLKGLSMSVISMEKESPPLHPEEQMLVKETLFILSLLPERV